MVVVNVFDATITSVVVGSASPQTPAISAGSTLATKWQRDHHVGRSAFTAIPQIRAATPMFTIRDLDRPANRPSRDLFSKNPTSAIAFRGYRASHLHHRQNRSPSRFRKRRMQPARPSGFIDRLTCKHRIALARHICGIQQINQQRATRIINVGFA
jgi:hypothetical protein